jgi:hypothetical protein
VRIIIFHSLSGLMEGYTPITRIFRGISLYITGIIIAGRKSEAAIGGAGGAQRLVLHVK